MLVQVPLIRQFVTLLKHIHEDDSVNMITKYLKQRILTGFILLFLAAGSNAFVCFLYKCLLYKTA